MSGASYQSSSIEEDLQAFNCITAFLASLRNYQNDTHLLVAPYEGSRLTRIERMGLYLCTAFAQITVMNDEVVAVGVEDLGKVLDPLAPLQVVVSTKFPEPSSHSQPSELGCNINPGRNASAIKEDPLPSRPTIVSTKMPEEIAIGNTTLDDHLISLRSNASTHKLEEHLWILQNIFNTGKDPNNMAARLLPYIAATCYPKMHTRLKDPKSQSYLQALDNIPIDAISFVIASGKHSTPHEIECDVAFLEMFSEGTPENLFKKEYGVIHEAIEAGGSTESIGLYNSSTYREFHRLLLSMLKEFEDAAKKLVDLRKSASQPEPRFGILAQKIAWIGHGLYLLSRGAALRMHLQNIQSLLSPPEPDYSNEHKEGDEDERELDEEFEDQVVRSVPGAIRHALNPNQQPWEVYLRWLKVIISHFAAAPILIGSICKPEFPPISVQILQAPYVERVSMPWRKVLQNPRYFPEGLMSTRGYPWKSNAEILQFLDSGIQASETMKKIDLDWKAIQEGHLSLSTKTKKSRGIYDALIAMDESEIPNFDGDITAKDISDEIKAGFTDDIFSLEKVNSDLITKNIKSMLKTLGMFSNLAKDCLTFNGTTHCEVSLASLLSTDFPAELEGFEDISRALQAYGPIIGVSKPCCPMCYDVLQLFMVSKISNTPFRTGGRHNILSACALPNWLPSRIVDEMNGKYGAKLKEALTILIGRADTQRQRSNSSGSSALSSSSPQMPFVSLKLGRARLDKT